MFAVVVAAGPFSATSKAFVDACIRTKTHYLDITGEFPVFEAVLGRQAEAEAAGIVLLPGVGMDVVPSDCLAKRLSEALPNATHLEICVLPKDGVVSPGTMKTMLENMSEPTYVRKNKVLTPTHAVRTKDVAHPVIGTMPTMAISWGDIATAYHSTKIPNIATYMAMDPKQANLMKSWMGGAVRWTVSWAFVRWGLNKLIERYVRGPTEAQSGELRVYFTGYAWNAETYELVETSLTTLEGYKLTALSMVAAVHKLFTSYGHLKGALTPSQAFGVDYVLEFEHSTWTDIIRKQNVDANELKDRFPL